MSIFGCVLTDDCIQVDDRFRIFVDRNSVTPDEDAISLVEVDPDGSGTFYDVSADLFLDWQYAVEGSYTITLRVTAGPNNEEFTKDVEVKTAEQDCLFANDNDLLAFEPNIYDCLDCYRCSFKTVHRQVRECIMDCLLRSGLLYDGCNPIDLVALKSSDQLKKWATYWALELIYLSASKDPRDFYSVRSQYYSDLRSSAFSTYKVFYDEDGDGVIEPDEFRTKSNRLIRR